MRGRFKALVLAMALGAGAGLPAPAQTTGAGVTAGPTILTLDQDRLYAGSKFGQALEAQSADAAAKLAAENRKIEADLIAEEKSLTDQRAKLTAEAFKPLAETFDAKVETIRSEQDAKSKALQDTREAGRKRFFETALPILAELMRQRGALAILNKGAVIIAFDAVDVTDAAIQLVDAKLGDGSQLPPADGAAPKSP